MRNSSKQQNTKQPLTFEALSKQLAEVLKNQRKLNGEFRRVKRENSQLKRSISFLDPAGVHVCMGEIQEDAFVLHERLRTMLLKQTVFTELSHVLSIENEDSPDFYRLLVKSLDQSDHWWREGEELTLEQWVRRISSLSLQRLAA